MSVWATLKASIDAVITTNGTNDISGADVRGRLNQMVDDLGGIQFKGVAATSDTPPSYEGAQFWLAESDGTYTNFGAIVVNVNEIAFLVNDGTGWTKESITISADKWDIVTGTKIEPKDAAVVTLLIENIDAGTAQLKLNGLDVKIDDPLRDSVDALNDGSKVLGSDASGNPLWVSLSGNQNYQITAGSVEIDVTATGTGVTATNATGELTIDIPSGVDLVELKIKMPSSETDANDNYFILFDYTGLRDFNTSSSNFNLPVALMGSSDTTGIARTNPVLFSSDGNANIDMGVTSFGGGDGSDLEIGIYDFLVDSNQLLILKF